MISIGVQPGYGLRPVVTGAGRMRRDVMLMLSALVAVLVLALTDGTYDDGFKLFYDEDTHLFQPHDMLRLSPVPDLVSYQ